MKQTTKDKPHGVMKPFTKAEITAVKKRYGLIDEKNYTKTEKALVKKIKDLPPHQSPHNRGRPLLSPKSKPKK